MLPMGLSPLSNLHVLIIFFYHLCDLLIMPLLSNTIDCKYCFELITIKKVHIYYNNNITIYDMHV